VRKLVQHKDIEGVGRGGRECEYAFEWRRREREREREKGRERGRESQSESSERGRVKSETAKE